MKVDLQKGTGPVVTPAATVTVDYIGVACSTGRIFDSSYQQNQSFTTTLSDVVPGWQQGIPGMRVGGSRLLGIPPALGVRLGGQRPAHRARRDALVRREGPEHRTADDHDLAPTPTPPPGGRLGPYGLVNV